MAFNFFSITQKPNGFSAGSTATYPEAKPSGGSGAIDVHGSFRWKNKGSTEEVPSVLLTEYKLNTGARVSNLTNILLGGVKDLSNSKSFSDAANVVGNTIAKSTFGDPYQGLYIGDATGFHYNLPYLKSSGSIRGEGGNNEWGANKGLTDVIADMFPNLKEIGSMLGSAVAGLRDEGFGAEQIYKFTGASARTVTISFPLYNTYSLKEANDNFSFISLFGFQNLRTRTSYYSFLPPKVYTVDTQDEGGVYMPIAVVSGFKVDGIGALRKMSDFGQGTLGVNTSGYRLVPEAYKITITLKELIPETTNIMQGALGQSKVQVIGSTASVASTVGYRGISNSTGTLGNGYDVPASYDSAGSIVSQEDISEIPLSSTQSNEELASRPSVTNGSGYDPNASPNPSDPMNLNFVKNKNESGYDRNAATSDQDPMSLTYRAPAQEWSVEKSDMSAVESFRGDYYEEVSSEENAPSWVDEESKTLKNDLETAQLNSKMKVLENLTNQQQAAESEDEWNQIEATKKAVGESPLFAFLQDTSVNKIKLPENPQTSEESAVTQNTQRLISQQTSNFKTQTESEKVTFSDSSPSFKETEKSLPVVRPVDNSNVPVSPENLLQTQQTLMQQRADDVLNSLRQAKEESNLKNIEADISFGVQKAIISSQNMATSVREQARSVLENNKDLTAMTQLAKALNSTQEYIPPMPDFRGPVKVDGTTY